MRQHRSAAVAFEFPAESRAQNDSASQRDKSADRVDDRRSGEVMKGHARSRPEMAVAAHVREPPVRTPGPVTDHRIDEAGHADAVKKIADESRAADHRAGGDRRAGIGECELENPDGQERDTRRFIRFRRVLQEEPVIADKPVAVAEHEREADGVKQEAAKTRVDHALDEHVHRLARAAEPGFQHREADLHAEHQERRHKSPGGVHRIHHVGGFNHRRVVSEHVREAHVGHQAHDREHRQDADHLSSKHRSTVSPPLGIAHAQREPR